MTFKFQNAPSESIVGYATCEGEHYWIHCSGVNKINTMLSHNVNLLSRSPNSVFATKHNSPVPISADLAHRRAYYAGENRVRKMESCSDGIKLKKGAGATFPCAPCIKGKGHTLLFGKERSIRLKPGEYIQLDV